MENIDFLQAEVFDNADPAALANGILRFRLNNLQSITRPRLKEVLGENEISGTDCLFDDIPDDSSPDHLQQHVTKSIAALLSLALGDNASQNLPETSSSNDTIVSKDSVYHNLPLEPSASGPSLRLLELLPAKSLGDRVKARLFCYKPSDGHSFEALSYVWGPDYPRRAITVNGSRFTINTNLHNALKYLRLPDHSRYLWIDQICIDQQNIAEKSHQVVRMGDTYREASNVVIFFGPPSFSLSNFIDFVSRGGSDGWDEKSKKPLGELLKARGTDLADLARGVDEFCSAAWFSRVWVMQEFYLAQGDPLWYCGDKYASTSKIRQELERVGDPNAGMSRYVNLRLAHTGPKFESLLQRAAAEMIIRSGVGFHTLPRVLYTLLDKQATNARDYVFGVRYLLELTFQQVFVPDYSKPVEHVFEQLAVWLLSVDCWGDMLWYYPFRQSVKSPSWAPDFRRRVETTTNEITPITRGSLGPSMNTKCVIVDRILHIQGRQLGVIEEVFPLPSNGSVAILSELWKFNKQHYSRLPSGERGSSVFLWTSTTHSGDDVPLKHHDDFVFLPDLPLFLEVINSEFKPLKEKLKKEARDAGDAATGPLSGLSAGSLLARMDQLTGESSAFNREMRLWDLQRAFSTGAGFGDFAGGCSFDYDNLVFQLRSLGSLTRDERQHILESGTLATHDGKPGPLYLDLVRALYPDAAGDQEVQTNLALTLSIAEILHDISRYRWSRLELERWKAGDAKGARKSPIALRDLSEKAQDILKKTWGGEMGLDAAARVEEESKTQPW